MKSFKAIAQPVSSNVLQVSCRSCDQSICQALKHRFIMRNINCWHSRNLRDNWICRSSNSWLTRRHWCSRRWASVVRCLVNIIIIILQRLCSKIPIRHATHLAHQSGHIWMIHHHAGHGVHHHCQRVQQRRLLGPSTLACPVQTQGRHEKDDKWRQRRLPVEIRAKPWKTNDCGNEFNKTYAIYKQKNKKHKKNIYVFLSLIFSAIIKFEIFWDFLRFFKALIWDFLRFLIYLFAIFKVLLWDFLRFFEIFIFILVSSLWLFHVLITIYHNLLLFWELRQCQKSLSGSHVWVQVSSESEAANWQFSKLQHSQMVFMTSTLRSPNCLQVRTKAVTPFFTSSNYRNCGTTTKPSHQPEIG